MSYSLNEVRDNTNEEIERLFNGFPFESENIKKCTEKYAACNHVSKFSYVIYRIQQAVLSIFGYSDWQKARNEACSLLKQKFDSPIKLEQIKSNAEWNFIADRLIGVYVKRYEYIAENFAEKYFSNVMNSKDRVGFIREVIADFIVKFQHNPFKFDLSSR